MSAAGADALTAADIGAATAAQGALADATTVEQVTLNANLDYTLSAGTPAGVVHRATFTQDGTGGHTVTYNDLPVTVDTTAGAVTTVELHPAGAGYVVRYPVADLDAQVSALAEDGGSALGASLSSTYAPRNATTAVTLTDASQAITLPASALTGDTRSLVITADGGTPDWDSLITWDAGIAPTLSAVVGERDVLTFLYTGLDWLGFVSGVFAAPPDITAPSVPANLTATATGPTTVGLSWDASTDNIAVTGYNYRVDAGVAADAGAGTTETVAALTPGTLYSFEVQAYDAAGNTSAWSTAATATTPAGILDSFDRADNASSMGTADTGETWTYDVLTWGISSNTAFTAGAPASRGAALVDFGSADMAVSAKFTSRLSYQGIVARYVDVSNYYYVGWDGTSLMVIRRKAGANTNLVVVAGGIAQGDTAMLSTAEEGGATRVICTVNGVERYNGLDSTAGRPSSTKGGLLQVNNAAPVYFDDFSIVAP